MLVRGNELAGKAPERPRSDRNPALARGPAWRITLERPRESSAYSVTRVISRYRFPAGGDMGVESVGFVPPGFDPRGAAYLADLGAPGAPTPGTSSLLTLRGLEFVRAGVQPGDLLVATEGGAITFAIRCRQRCTVRQIGRGPTATQGEGDLTVEASSKDEYDRVRAKGPPRGLAGTERAARSLLRHRLMGAKRI